MYSKAVVREWTHWLTHLKSICACAIWSRWAHDAWSQRILFKAGGKPSHVLGVMAPVGSRGKASETSGNWGQGSRPPTAESNLKSKWPILRSGFDHFNLFWYIHISSIGSHLLLKSCLGGMIFPVGEGAICGTWGLSPSPLAPCPRPCLKHGVTWHLYYVVGLYATVDDVCRFDVAAINQSNGCNYLISISDTSRCVGLHLYGMDTVSALQSRSP